MSVQEKSLMAVRSAKFKLLSYCSVTIMFLTLSLRKWHDIVLEPACSLQFLPAVSQSVVY